MVLTAVIQPETIARELLRYLLVAPPLLALCLLCLRQALAGPAIKSTPLPSGQLPESQRSARLAPATSGEGAALVELRKLTRAALPTAVLDHGADQLDDDSWCCRFLISSGWQAQPASSQVADTLRWRHFRREPMPPC